jgi:hypothetical protein
MGIKDRNLGKVNAKIKRARTKGDTTLVEQLEKQREEYKLSDEYKKHNVQGPAKVSLSNVRASTHLTATTASTTATLRQIKKQRVTTSRTERTIVDGQLKEVEISETKEMEMSSELSIRAEQATATYLAAQGEEATAWLKNVLETSNVYKDFELRLDPYLQKRLSDYFKPVNMDDGERILATEKCKGLYKFAELPLADCIASHQLEWSVVADDMQQITATYTDPLPMWTAKYDAVSGSLGLRHPIAQIVRSVLFLFQCKAKCTSKGTGMFCGAIDEVITKQRLIHVHDRIPWTYEECLELLRFAQAIEKKQFSLLLNALVSFQVGLRRLAGKPVAGIQLQGISSAPSSGMFLPKIDLHRDDAGWYQMIYEEREEPNMGKCPKFIWDYMQCHIVFEKTPYTASLLFPIATDQFRNDHNAHPVFIKWAGGELVRVQLDQLFDRSKYHADGSGVYSNGITYPTELLKRPEFSFLLENAKAEEAMAQARFEERQLALA